LGVHPREADRPRRQGDVPTYRPAPSIAWLRAVAIDAYTASGAVLALLIVLAAIDGDEVRALWLGLAALIIDGTDGMLARRFRVRAHLASFDGARMDDIVDYLTYVFAPIVLLHQGGYLPAGATGTVVAALPLLASCYQFCRTDAKTADHLFRGFPSYWNIVAFYAVTLDLSAATTTAVLLICVALVPVPLGYVYPSRTVPFRAITLALTGAWLVCYAVILAQMPDPGLLWTALSLLYVAYYVGLSLYLEARRRRPRERPAAVPRVPALVDD
jgi:phosphatidylcholine synthase